MTLRLAAAGWEATLLPDRGAAVAALRLDGADVLLPVPPGADPNTGFHGAYLMAPWCNRLDGGRLAPGWTMPLNRPQDGTAIHGLVRDLPWRVAQAGDAAARLELALDHPPFRLDAALEVALGAEGFRLSLALRNAGADAVPCGIGWHPFFRAAQVAFRATTVFGRDARTLPRDPRPSAGLAGGPEAWEGLDTHFAGWDGVARIGALRLEAEGAWRRNLQVFAPPGAGFVCVEPMSHAPDAPNNAQAAAHGPLAPLAPGAVVEGALRLHRAPAAEPLAAT